jgi:lauroyl/myristoyl acyltransferase
LRKARVRAMPDRPGDRPRSTGVMRAAIEPIVHALSTAALLGLAAIPAVLTDPALGWIGRLLVRRHTGEPAFVAAALACPLPMAVHIAARARANWQRAKLDFRRCLRRPAAPGRVRACGEHHLRAAYAQGNGVILATVHTTAILPALWSALQLAPRFGYRVHGVGYVDLRDAALGIAGFAQPVPGPTELRTSRALLDALGSGAALLLPIDVLTAYGDVSSIRPHWVETRYLGSQAVFSTGAATLARLARAPIIPAVTLRTGPGRYTVTFLEAIPPATDRRRDREVMHRALAALEAPIRAHPDQYCWWLYAWAPPPPPG